MSVLSVPILVRGLHVWDASRMPAEELQNRRDRMCGLLASRGLDGVLCYADSISNGYVEYFTNYNCLQPFTNVMLVMTADGDCCLIACVPPRDIAKIKGGFIPGDLEVKAAGMSPVACDHIGQKTVEYLAGKNLTGKRWGGINLSRCMKKAADDLEAAVPEITDLTGEFEKIRAVKTEAEIGIIRGAAALAKAAVLDIADACADGADECVIASHADELARCAGAEDVQVMLGTSETGGFLRPAQKRTLKNGETVKILCQTEYLRYRGLFAATVTVGGGSSGKIEEYAGKFSRLLAGISSGAAFNDEWKTELGVEENTYSSVHGIGQDQEEAPSKEFPSDRFEENMVLSVLLESDADCVIFADTVLCTEKGALSLSGQEPEA